MKFFELSHIGGVHVNHNEDAFVLAEAGVHRTLVAVMDGCSSGSDSHFASTLIAKVLRKIAKEESYREYALGHTKTLKDQIESVSLRLFEELSNLNRQLDLRSDEMLSTLILCLVDKRKKQAELLIVGDGYIHVNGRDIEYENDNKPDYIAYHLNKEKEEWYSLHTERLSIERVDNLTISTDGIHTFKNFDGQSYEAISEAAIRKKFFESMEDLDNPNKLKKVLLDLESNYGLLPSDDLTMIRLLST